MTRARRETWLFWTVALVVLAAGLGLRDPWPADEPRFALVAKQMVESGDWLFPHRGTELYSDKPPMLMWMQAALYTLLRDWRIAFLLPSLLAALGTLWCVVDLGRRLWTRRVGLCAGYLLLFAVQFTYQAKKAQIDPLVTFWITLGVYALVRHALRGPDWRMWALAWFAAGIGTITKGVGVIALFMLVPIAFAAWRRWPGVTLPLRDARAWLGPLAFVVAVSVWLVPMVATALLQDTAEHRAYLHDILFRQTAQRYANSWHHVQPPWYHLGVMATMWLPALLALPWALPAWRRRLRRRDARYLLPLAWWALVLVFFAIPDGKRDVYILPALPMACLALAPLLPGLLRRAGLRWLAFAFGLVLAAAATAAGLAMLVGEPGFEQRLLRERGWSDASAAAGLLLAIGAWGLAALAWHRVRRAYLALAWLLGGTWVLFSFVGYPLLNDSTSARALMHAAGRHVGPGAELGLVAWREQNLLQADRPAATFGFLVPWPEQLARGIAWQRDRPGARWLLVQDPALGACIDRTRAVRVGAANRRDWWLVPAAAVRPGCDPRAR